MPEETEQGLGAFFPRHWCRWEYRAEVFFKPDGSHDSTPDLGAFTTRLNRLGEQGWEVYALAPGVAHLKRQIYLEPPLKPEQMRRPSQPMSPLVKGAPAK